MDTGLQAAADRIWYDSANVTHILSLLDDDLLARRCAATGWTVAETIGHIADTLERCGATLERATAQEAAGAGASTSPPGLLARLGHGRDRAMRAITRLTPDHSLLSIEGQLVDELVRDAAVHCGAHSLDFLEAVPEFGQDVMVLNWALHQQPEDAARAARRTAAIDKVRTWIAQQDNGKD